jgi:hypothetical protein
MKMKKSIFIFSCFFMFVFPHPLFSQDSEFLVSLEINSENDQVYIVFENTTTDSLIIFSTFERFDIEAVSSGFVLEFYNRQGELMLVEWGSYLSRVYEYENGRTSVGALQAVKFPIWLPYLGSDVKGFKIICRLRCRYLNFTKRKFEGFFFAETEPVYFLSNKTYRTIPIRIETEDNETE